MSGEAAPSPATPGRGRNDNIGGLRPSEILERAGGEVELKRFDRCPQCSHLLSHTTSATSCAECGLPVAAATLVVPRLRHADRTRFCALFGLVVWLQVLARPCDGFSRSTHVLILATSLTLLIVVAIVWHQRPFRWVGLARQGAFIGEGRRRVLHIPWTDLTGVDTSSSRRHVVLKGTAGREIVRLGWKFLFAKRLMRLAVDLMRAVVERGDTSFLPNGDGTTSPPRE